MDTLAEKLLNYWNYFLRLSGFLVFLEKYFWSLLSSPTLITQQCFAIAMQIRQLNFLSFVKYGEIITVKGLKSKKKKLALTLFYYVSREIWLANSKKLICIDQSRFEIFSHPREFKNVNIFFTIPFLAINHLQAESGI